MEEKKKKQSIIIPKPLLILSILLLALICLFIYDKNLFPVGDVELKPGVYEFTGEEAGQIIVSEGNNIMFKDFDLNTHLSGFYYSKKIDLNKMFLDHNRTFYIVKGLSGIYSVLCDVSETERLEIDYYPREDKLVLLKPGSTSEFCFVYKDE